MSGSPGHLSSGQAEAHLILSGPHPQETNCPAVCADTTLPVPVTSCEIRLQNRLPLSIDQELHSRKTLEFHVLDLTQWSGLAGDFGGRSQVQFGKSLLSHMKGLGTVSLLFIKRLQSFHPMTQMEALIYVLIGYERFRKNST